jgi:hypothetical protein
MYPFLLQEISLPIPLLPLPIPMYSPPIAIEIISLMWSGLHLKASPYEGETYQKI